MKIVLVVLLLLSLVTGAAAEIDPVTITAPSDGDLCGEAWLCAEGTVAFSEDHRVMVFWKGLDGLWYVGDNPVPTEGEVWESCIVADPVNVVAIRAIFMYLGDAQDIESDKEYTEEELAAISLYAVEVSCTCSEPRLNIISPPEGKDVGYDNVQIPVEGTHNLFEEDVTLWLAGYTETNANVWPLGTVDKEEDGSFSGIAHPGNCDVTCGATNIKIIVFALRPPGVEVWEETSYMTPEEFDEFLDVYSCIDNSVTVYRPCTEPTPVPSLTPIGMIVLIGLLGLIGMVRIKRR